MRNIVYWVEIPVKSYESPRQFYEDVFVEVRDLSSVPQQRHGRLPLGLDILRSGTAIAEHEEYAPLTCVAIIYLDNGKDLIIPISKGINEGGRVLLRITQVSASSLDS